MSNETNAENYVQPIKFPPRPLAIQWEDYIEPIKDDVTPKEEQTVEDVLKSKHIEEEKPAEEEDLDVEIEEKPIDRSPGRLFACLNL